MVKSKKKKGKSKTEEPQKPISAFMIFVNEQRSRLKTERPKLGLFEASKLIAKEWKSNFDYVIVDGGQAYSMSANSTYTVSDATYLVVRLGKTNRNEADQVVQQLLESQVPLNGCVVTNLP